METKIFLWGYFSSALGLVTWCAPSLLNVLLRALVWSQPAGSQTVQRVPEQPGDWLTSEGKAGKSDLLCILNKPLTWTQEAHLSQGNRLGCSASILKVCWAAPWQQGFTTPWVRTESLTFCRRCWELTREASTLPVLLGLELQKGVEMAGNVERSGQCWAFFIS